ncbi:MAG: hypothetical protein ACLR17_06505 [Enterobacteriaceae bacterium]
MHKGPTVDSMMGNQRADEAATHLQTARERFSATEAMALDTIAAEAGTRATLYIFPAAKTRCCWRRSRFSMTPCGRLRQLAGSSAGSSRAAARFAKWCNNTFMRRRIFTFSAY